MVKQRRGCKLTNTVKWQNILGRPLILSVEDHKYSYKSGKTHLSHAIRKYGWDNFQQEILIEDVPEEDLNNLEMSYIKIFDTTNRKKGYNLTAGGEGTTGWKISDEHKEKIRMAHKKHSAEKGSISFSKQQKKWLALSAITKDTYWSL